jgi:transposase-like protein
MPRGRPKKTAGRNTKLTSGLQSELLAMLTTGAYIEHACKAVGLHPATYYNWINLGQEYANDLELGKTPNKKSRVFFEFFEAVERARARTATRVVGLVMRAAEKDWRAGAFWLERSFPKEWGRQRLEVSGPDGEPIEVESSSSNVLIVLPHNSRDALPGGEGGDD